MFWGHFDQKWRGKLLIAANLAKSVKMYVRRNFIPAQVAVIFFYCSWLYCLSYFCWAAYFISSMQRVDPQQVYFSKREVNSTWVVGCDVYYQVELSNIVTKKGKFDFLSCFLLFLICRIYFQNMTCSTESWVLSKNPIHVNNFHVILFSWVSSFLVESLIWLT